VITIDTSVLIYLWDTADPEKQAVAQSLVAKLSPAGAPLALQVIGETQNVLRRKLKQPPWEAAQNARNLLVAFDSFTASEANVAEALSLLAAGRMSYGDGLLLTAARDAGCTTLLSEDLQDGFRLGGLLVVSPFKDGGPSPALLALLN
jgi:predicted nucleic acid-binding protein